MQKEKIAIEKEKFEREERMQKEKAEMEERIAKKMLFQQKRKEREEKEKERQYQLTTSIPRHAMSHLIVVTIDALHRTVECFHLHAGIADYFHHGGQTYQNFVLQLTKWIKSAISS